LCRSVGLYFFLNIITLGIYGIFFWHGLIRDANDLLKEDGKHTPGVLPLYMFSFLTLGIYFWIWQRQFCRRMVGFGGTAPFTVNGCCLSLVVKAPLFLIVMPIRFCIAQKELIEAFNLLVLDACFGTEDDEDEDDDEDEEDDEDKESNNDLYW